MEKASLHVMGKTSLNAWAISACVCVKKASLHEGKGVLLCCIFSRMCTRQRATASPMCLLFVALVFAEHSATAMAQGVRAPSLI